MFCLFAQGVVRAIRSVNSRPAAMQMMAVCKFMTQVILAISLPVSFSNFFLVLAEGPELPSTSFKWMDPD